MIEIVRSQAPLDKPSAAASQLDVCQPDPTKIAVMLNRNAKQVTDRVVQRFERIVGTDHVYYSRTLDEAEAFSREIIQKGYGTIVSGGGDGTLCGTINFMRRYIAESNAWRVQRFERFGEKQALIAMPRFAFLKLGTGNGIGEVLGATNPTRDLKRLIDYLPGRNLSVDMIDADGDQCFVAGFGYDSVLLNDYNNLKKTTNNIFLKPLMHTVIGYLAAAFTRMVPRAIFQDDRLEARVVSRGKGYYVDPRRGDMVIPIEPGTTLWDGRAQMIGAGSAPYFGSGFRAYPFATMMPGMMNLRIVNVGPLEAITHLPSLWRGNYRNPDALFDFLVEDVDIELARPFPFQHSGDSQDLRDHLRLKINPSPIQLVDFHSPRTFS